MLRILFYFAVVFLLGLGFAWLAERPGQMVVTFGGYRYEVTLMVAAVVVVAVVAVVMLLWWIVRGVWNSPYMVARYFRVRRRDRGYQALSSGMIAAGSGDGGLARRMGREAAKLISSDREPLIHLLDAQAALLEGDRQAARDKFTAMLDDPEMRLLGLRGLYLEAERLGEREAARHYAERAVEDAPQLEWAVNAALDGRTGAGDWDGALKLLDARKPSGQADRDAVARRRAVLLTAKAMDRLDSDPQAARAAALEANRLLPDFVPAALAAARALFRQNELRKGSRILETAWKKTPHPELADVYIHARPGDSTQDRLARARRLQSMKQNNVESALAVGRAALDAGAFKEAREACEAAARLGPRESVYLLMADIEEAETGDQGRVRHWLAKAVRAPRDPAWVADGYVSERWAPVSPVSGKLDAFEWRAPMERLAQLVEGEEDFRPAQAIAAAPAAAAHESAETTTDAAQTDTAQAEAAETDRVEEAVVIDADADARREPAAAEGGGEPRDGDAQEPAQPGGTAEKDRRREDTPAGAAAQQPANPASPPTGNGGDDAAAEKKKRERNDNDGEGNDKVAPPSPDDPGIESDDANGSTSGRFRLF